MQSIDHLVIGFALSLLVLMAAARLFDVLRVALSSAPSPTLEIGSTGDVTLHDKISISGPRRDNEALALEELET
jgi:hypothetical protein